MPPAKKYLDRNDLARLLEVSVDAVRNNELRWGLAQFSVRFNDRTLRFHREETLNQLRKLGFLPKEAQ